MEIIKGKVTWYDIINPTEDDLKWLEEEHKFHSIIIDELKQPSARTHVETYDDYLYLVYQFPIYDANERVSRRSEVDFLITKQSVITIRYEALDPIDGFRASLENQKLKTKYLQNTLQLTYNILESFLNFNDRQLRHVQEKVESISGQLFKDREKELLKDISYLKRDLSEYRIIMSPQEQFLRSFFENGLSFWGNQARIYLNDLIGDYQKVMNRLEDYRQAVADYQHTNDQLMNIKTTQVMKKFTALSFLTFPFMLFAAIFSMNTISTPIVDRPEGFWILLLMIFSGILGMFGYFKRKDWL